MCQNLILARRIQTGQREGFSLKGLPVSWRHTREQLMCHTGLADGSRDKTLWVREEGMEIPGEIISTRDRVTERKLLGRMLFETRTLTKNVREL